MTRIDWSPSVPMEVAGALAPILERWLFVVPSWCHVLRVVWDSGLGEHPAEVAAQAEYRYAEVTFGPTWLNEDAGSREDQVVHELCHLLVVPISDFVDDAMEADAGGDAFKVEQWRRANESTVQDLTRAFLDARSR